MEGLLGRFAWQFDSYFTAACPLNNEEVGERTSLIKLTVGGHCNGSNRVKDLTTWLSRAVMVRLKKSPYECCHCQLQYCFSFAKSRQTLDCFKLKIVLGSHKPLRLIM